jgi:outer membrane protein OmpA-like peptidoglycan-associated protein
MSLNLIDSLKGLINNEFIGKAASFLGENESSVSKAANGMVPVVLSGILSKAGSDGGTSILDMAKQVAGSGILDNLGGLFSGSGSNMLSMGSNLLSGIFGNKFGGLSNLLSNYAGIKQSSTNSLLSAIAPIAMSLIGKHVVSNGLSANGLMSWLGAQKDTIARAIPSGLNLSSILGDAGSTVRETAHTIRRDVEPKAGMPKWLLPLLLLLLITLAVWYFMRGCGGTTTTPMDTSAVVQPDTMAPAPVAAAPARESFKVKLPDGAEIDAYRGGIEDRLVTFLNSDWKKLGADSLKNTWFDFDNLNFEVGSAKITAESQPQVNNIAAILKAFPDAKIKIGGYTDKTGDAAANKKLSQERADATLAAIKAAGAKASQLLGAEGYGSQFAIVPAEASDEERKKDRRISVSVREK